MRAQRAESVNLRTHHTVTDTSVAHKTRVIYVQETAAGAGSGHIHVHRGGRGWEKLHLLHRASLLEANLRRHTHDGQYGSAWGSMRREGVGVYRSIAASAARETNPGPRGRTGHPFGHSGSRGGEGWVQVGEEVNHAQALHIWINRRLREIVLRVGWCIHGIVAGGAGYSKAQSMLGSAQKLLHTAHTGGEPPPTWPTQAGPCLGDARFTKHAAARNVVASGSTTARLRSVIPEAERLCPNFKVMQK